MMSVLYKTLDYLGRWVTFIIVVTVLLSVVGIVFAVSDVPVSVSNKMEVILPIAFLGQLLLLAGYIGRSLNVQKNTSKAVESLGKKHDSFQDVLGELKVGMTTEENKSKEYARRIKDVEDTQRMCAWFNRQPAEFVKKNGR